MTLSWVREESPVWDADKQRVIGGAPEGAFVIPFHEGDELPGDWWRVVSNDGSDDGADDGAVVGYGRLDTTWGGDAEILLASDPAHQERGVGSFVLDRLEREAEDRGINYVHNTIRAEHPDRDVVHDWLVVRGFRGTVDGDLRKRVGSTRHEPAPEPPAALQEVPQDAMPPGHEESGGYVDVEDHQY